MKNCLIKNYLWSKLSLDERKNILKRPAMSQQVEFKAKVREIVESVKNGGDAQIIEMTKNFDKVSLTTLEVSKTELSDSYSKIVPKVLACIESALVNIEAFHKLQIPIPIELEVLPGVKCMRRALPIDRVGLYVPGGTAPLVSTVLMLGVPANLAKCETKILCTPPGPDGSINPYILVTAQLVGIKRIFKIGGAQAISAMAYGSESVPKVDKIFGPGNNWVSEAKMLCASDAEGAACDMPAGPSEVMVLADSSSNSEFVAADLLSQAEHSVDAQVILVSDSAKLIEDVGKCVESQLEELPRKNIAEKALLGSLSILVENRTDFMDIVNSYAPIPMFSASIRSVSLSPMTKDFAISNSPDVRYFLTRPK